MADFEGRTNAQLSTIASGYPGRNPDAHKQAPAQATLTVDDPSALDPNGYVGATFSDDGLPGAATTVDHKGRTNDKLSCAEEWFESFHVIPRSFAFGNLLTPQSEDITVHSAFRKISHNWTLFTNNAGAGTTLVGLPSLPRTFAPQESLTMQLQVDTDGPASVDSTLEFVFGTVPQTIFVPITFDRVVLFVPEPELPYVEFLEFLTDVMEHKDGTEQRFKLRKSPRQFFQWNWILEDGVERSKFHNTLFEWQTRVFGIPVWHDETILTSAASINDTVINVRDTTYGDFRAGGLVVLYTDENTFDVHTIDSLTATSITLTSKLLNSHVNGTRVAPVVTAVIEGSPTGGRFPTASGTARLNFRVTDNDISIASTAAFSSFNSKVLIDGCNLVQGQLEESFEQNVIVIDSETGLSKQFSTWSNNRRGHGLTLLAQGRQSLWETRQLLHALGGRQTSFYAASFSEDLTPNADLGSGSALLSIANVGYTKFVQSRQPRDVIRVVFNDGTPDVLRTVLSSVEVDSTTETLTVDTVWAATYPTSTIKQIEFVEKVRWDTDRIQISHERGARRAKISGPIKAVLG